MTAQGIAENFTACDTGTLNRFFANYLILKRLTLKLGYDPRSVWSRLFRHTFANDWLAGGGQEGDLMRLMGWTDRQMLDRYAADMQDQRAMDAKFRCGDMYPGRCAG